MLQTIILNTILRISVWWQVLQFATNGRRLCDGRDLKDKSFNLAQMPNRRIND
jgi:hypothetical protein